MFCDSRVETQPRFETKGAGVLKLGAAAEAEPFAASQNLKLDYF